VGHTGADDGGQRKFLGLRLGHSYFFRFWYARWFCPTRDNFRASAAQCGLQYERRPCAAVSSILMAFPHSRQMPRIFFSHRLNRCRMSVVIVLISTVFCHTCSRVGRATHTIFPLAFCPLLACSRRYPPLLPPIRSYAVSGHISLSPSAVLT